MLDEILSKYSNDYGFVELKTPLSIDRYREFLKKGYDANLHYLANHLEKKEKPQNLMKEAKSAIVFTKNYIPHPEPKALPNGLKIASYAKGYDYHHWFLKDLRDITDRLKEVYPDEEFLCFTDSAPILERDLGIRAGLGWIGKNACLIEPKKGSFFFIGEIYTTLTLEENKNQTPDRCGTCSRCIEACPTDAIKEDRFIDSNLCISYWTIEANEAPPLPLRKKMSGWHFGCDICQEVCPWNQKAFGKDFFTTKNNSTEEEIKKDISWVLRASNREMEREFDKTPLKRASSKSHRRNAVLACVHYKLTDLKGEIHSLGSRFEDLKEICDWALGELGSEGT